MIENNNNNKLYKQIIYPNNKFLEFLRVLLEHKSHGAEKLYQENMYNAKNIKTIDF